MPRQKNEEVERLMRERGISRASAFRLLRGEAIETIDTIGVSNVSNAETNDTIETVPETIGETNRQLSQRSMIRLKFGYNDPVDVTPLYELVVGLQGRVEALEEEVAGLKARTAPMQRYGSTKPEPQVLTGEVRPMLKEREVKAMKKQVGRSYTPSFEEEFSEG